MSHSSKTFHKANISFLIREVHRIFRINPKNSQNFLRLSNTNKFGGFVKPQILVFLNWDFPHSQLNWECNPMSFIG